MNPPLVPELSGLPLDDIRAIAANAPGRDDDAARAAEAHQRALYFAPAERGKLASLPVWLAGWQGRVPAAARVELCLFAGAQRWLGQEQAERAEDEVRKRILLLSAGGATSNPLAASLGAGLKVFDLAVERPAPNPAEGPAMSDRECVAAMAFGMEAVVSQADILCLGAFGIGTREAAASVALALFGGAPSDWLAGQTAALSAPYALALRQVEAVREGPAWTTDDPLRILHQVGNRELAALAGAILAARTQRVVVILDGYEAAVAAAVLAQAQPGLADHCLVAARDGSAAHDRLIEALGAEPLLDLGIEKGDGLAALLAAQIIRTACDIHTGGATEAQMEGLLSDAGEAG
ncbi:nicotinate-nucleotide--dimethylbenzimidazole phosphoribosyltransferase [Pedomonas mirosovicensis]|uniref:nicotinate-nucleotide--dimethylbenzimidazole phosphoribosyltransferase n=1 Tax=Pedomonas mirosovicensis TaxID=2908641 RepID=UPI0021686FCC|nr:nicotinate-nucleotide--dimethylbenzimidazole phosphoribosyltransferase [Pedomonas mirosovicensis]MCH8684618.1 nicotinate-nucleotide--dimethylbenzimidazole phosphoribosyltransferase [Pedomonas mirosovicensis]